MCSLITNNFAKITEFSDLKSLQGPLQDGKIKDSITVQLTDKGLTVAPSGSTSSQVIDIKKVSKDVLRNGGTFTSNDLPHLQSFTALCKKTVKDNAGVLYKLGLIKNQDIAEIEEFICGSELYQKFLNCNPKERFELICHEDLNKDNSKISFDRGELLKKMRTECSYVNIGVLEKTRRVTGTGGRSLLPASTIYNTGQKHPLTLFPNASQLEDLSKDPTNTFKELCDSTYKDKGIHLTVCKGAYENILEGFKWVKPALTKNNITVIEMK